MATPTTVPGGMSAALVLGVWEAATSERSVQRVIESAADAILPFVPFDAVGLVSFKAACTRWLYVVGIPARDDETPGEYCDRPEFAKRISVPARPVIPYGNGNELKDAFICEDLLAREVWSELEAELASTGVRAYAWLPLFFGGELLGAALFARATATAFTSAQVALLTAVSRPLGTAAANALANDEIRRLREEMQAENLELKAQLGQAPWFGEIVGESQAMRRVLARVEQVATTDATVLIIGETGTGKELFARALHGARGAPTARWSR